MASNEGKEIAEKKSDGNMNKDSKENNSSLISKFGKFFLIAVILCMQGWLAYFIVGNNYKAIYKFMHTSKKEPGVFYEIKNVVVNPAGSKGERYLLVSLGIEVDNKNDLSIIKKQNPVIRDRIITTLAQESMPELNSIGGRHKLKVDLLHTINHILNKKVVRNLFFTEYVMQ